MLGDELIGHLLALHGIHPESVETRLARVIDELRAAVSDQGGTVELDRLDETVAVVRVALGAAGAAVGGHRAHGPPGGDDRGAGAGQRDDRARRERERDGVRAAGCADADRPPPRRLPMTDALGRVIRRARRRGPVGERCDLCAVELPEEHRHLLDTDRREISCVCQACSLLFNREAASDGHYRLVPRRRIRLPEVPTEGLGVPVGLAFFVPRSGGTVDAHYPSPAGPTRWEVDQAAWRDVVARCPPLADMAPEVEALLVNTTRGRLRALARADRRLLRARRPRAPGMAEGCPAVRASGRRSTGSSPP